MARKAWRPSSAKVDSMWGRTKQVVLCTECRVPRQKQEFCIVSYRSCKYRSRSCSLRTTRRLPGPQSDQFISITSRIFCISDPNENGFDRYMVLRKEF